MTYSFYQTGRVKPSAKWFNLLVLTCLAGMLGSGSFAFCFVGLIHSAGVAMDWENPFFAGGVIALGALATAVAYYYTCSKVEHEFYNLRRKDAAEWKCQPKKWLRPEMHREEVVWGTINAAIGATCGLIIVVIRLHPASPEWARVKVTFDLSDTTYAGPLSSYGGGWPYYFLTVVLCFFYTDLWAYTAHRILHWPILYRNVHKWHHRYEAVTAFGAYAMHPAEFLFITLGTMSVAYVVPMHLSAIALNLTYTGYHAIIIHSGVDFDGLFPWEPSTMYHDDHHTCFHCNFGQSLVLWDWLAGSLRHSRGKYSETHFHDTIGGAEHLNH